MDELTRILLVEDLPADAGLAEREIRKTLGACVFSRVDTKDAFLAALREFNPDIIISDYRMPQFDGMTALQLALDRLPLTPFIILTSAINEDTAVECMKAGASDYIIKEHMKRLGSAVLHALQERKNRMARKDAERDLLVRTHAVDSSISAIGIADFNGKILYVNDSYCRLWKFPTKEEILGKKMSDFVLNGEQAIKIFDMVRQHGSYLGEEEAVCMDGSRINVLLSVNMVSDSDGKPNCVMASFLDISELKRAERETREWKDRYEMISTLSHMAFYDHCIDTDTISWSRNMENIFGTKALVIPEWSKYSQKNLHPEDPNMQDEIARMIKDTGQFHVEGRFKSVDGKFLYVSNRGYKRLDTVTGFAHYYGVVEDITERKKNEETMHLLAHTMESITEIARITNLDNRLIFVNDAFLKTYGYTREEVIGQHVQMFGSPNNFPGLPDAIYQETLKGSWKGEVLDVAKDGREIPLMLRTSQIKNGQGKVIGLVGILEDLTERKLLEAQFLQAQKMEAVGRLAGGVAHDFNNMIGVILGYATLMEQKFSTSDPLLHNVQAIISAAQRSANLTRQLLAFARKQVIAPISLDLNEILQSLQAMLARLIGEDISLTVRPGKNLWNVKMDPTQVDQILANLVTNARDAIENVGNIVIETSNIVVDQEYAKESFEISPGNYVVITVSDTGKGMDKETQSRIFEPFFTTKPSGHGTGLGLSTVFGIVKQNGGAISVSSEIGHGTSMKLFFRRHYGEAEQRTATQAAAMQSGTETILIVEDERELLDLGKYSLEMCGYTVLTASSPAEALRICEQTGAAIRVLITDVVMPGMNGKQLEEKIKSILPEIKTIFMSGYTADVVAKRGILEMGVRFLQKPFRPDDLASIVYKTLNGDQ
jgi:PAS domain S-box-containing protein